jgi:hypothetical protein
MKAHITTAIILCLALMTSQANAIPVWKKTEATFVQASNSTLLAGLIVQAETDRPMLGVGGGFTVTCTTGSLTIAPREKAEAYDFFGPDVTVNVPVVTPGSYTIPGWSGIPAGSCGGQCGMHWKAEAVDSALQFTLSISGSGGAFTLLPTGGIVREDDIIRDICRSGTPQCCTVGCQLP